MTREQKMRFRWLGPYQVTKAIPEKGTYVLAELDGAELGGTVAGNRLKKFHVREANPIEDFAYPASKVPDRVSMVFNLLRLRSELVMSSF